MGFDGAGTEFAHLALRRLPKATLCIYPVTLEDLGK